MFSAQTLGTLRMLCSLSVCDTNVRCKHDNRQGDGLVKIKMR